MYIQLACPLPEKIMVACSGGPDSMALLSFLRQGRRRNIQVLHINHNTEHAIQAEQMVKQYCKDHKIPLEIRTITNKNHHNENLWREERLMFYKEFVNKGFTIATAHHLDDVIEWYLLSGIHGKSILMKPEDKEHGLIKPFLLATKDDLLEWCRKRDVPYVIDPTNIGSGNARAILRQSVIPNLLRIHPGMKTSIKRLLEAQINKMEN